MPHRWKLPLVRFLRFVLLGFGVVLFAGISSTNRAQAAPNPAAYKRTMDKGLAYYKQKKWDDALEEFQQALKYLKGAPAYRKQAAMLYIGLCFYYKKQPGMAWKALEQALYLQPAMTMPAEESKDVKAFFNKVRTRVARRGAGVVLSSRGSAPSGAPALGTVLTWGLGGLAGAAVISGVLLMMNSSANQAQLDQFLVSASGQSLEPDKLNASVEGMKSSISTQSTLGIVSFVVAALAAGGAVTSALFLTPKSTAASAQHTFPASKLHRIGSAPPMLVPSHNPAQTLYTSP